MNNSKKVLISTAMAGIVAAGLSLSKIQSAFADDPATEKPAKAEKKHGTKNANSCHGKKGCKHGGQCKGHKGDDKATGGEDKDKKHEAEPEATK